MQPEEEGMTNCIFYKNRGHKVARMAVLRHRLDTAAKKPTSQEMLIRPLSKSVTNRLNHGL